jgi:hypothetical protein
MKRQISQVINNLGLDLKSKFRMCLSLFNLFKKGNLSKVSIK